MARPFLPGVSIVQTSEGRDRAPAGARTVRCASDREMAVHRRTMVSRADIGSSSAARSSSARRDRVQQQGDCVAVGQGAIGRDLPTIVDT